MLHTRETFIHDAFNSKKYRLLSTKSPLAMLFIPYHISP